MTSVSVLVPFRGDGGHRDAAWVYVQDWWKREHPDWQVLQGTGQSGPWVKAAAVRDALTRADGDVVVVADADVVTDGIGRAVEEVAAGRTSWAIPHELVFRLTPDATLAILAGAPLPTPGRKIRRRSRQSGRRGTLTATPTAEVLEAHAGAVGGGMVALPRALYERVPLDPRFQFWGQEDLAWGRALTVLCGQPWMGGAALWHCWHPEPERHSRRIGNAAGLALRVRYRNASTVAAMTALLAEFSAVV